jgi:predicted phosphodiesterase
MKIAVLSDIHGNAVGLDAVLADLKQSPVDQMVCLGDAIQGGPQPAEVTRRLRELGLPVVMGNADAWLLSGVETGNENISPERRVQLDAVREWSLAQLCDDDKAYIASFQPTVEIPLTGAVNLLGFHGTPTSFDDMILPTTPDDTFMEWCGGYTPHILCGGHTHLQQVRRIGVTESFFFNPGSVGLAYSHMQTEANFRADAWAEYAVLTVHGSRISLEFRRVPYNLNELINAYRRSQRPHLESSLRMYGALQQV